MSMSPDSIQQLLTAQLQQGAPQGSVGGQQGTVSPMNAAATLAQKVMLMKALQGRQQTQAANGMLPQTHQMMQNDPQMQALQQGPQMQMPPMDMSQIQPGQLPMMPQQMDPNALPLST